MTKNFLIMDYGTVVNLDGSEEKLTQCPYLYIKESNLSQECFRNKVLYRFKTLKEALRKRKYLNRKFIGIVQSKKNTNKRFVVKPHRAIFDTDNIQNGSIYLRKEIKRIKF